ncbi:hypothetical protein SORBI_3002G378500 [Sorghum bicolor]|uniref:Uncharacterized protein n=1 Tax=Sorghum bicolor TaxID=4558 RepID=A0A1B6QFP1_SORBI|nr:hypothetical protein SORBI_3002G378500 [Sorghum bicolor]
MAAPHTHDRPTQHFLRGGKKKGAGHDECALARMRERNGKPRASSSRLRTTLAIGTRCRRRLVARGGYLCRPGRG